MIFLFSLVTCHPRPDVIGINCSGDPVGKRWEAWIPYQVRNDESSSYPPFDKGDER
jgi:hypothetical protein